MGERVLLRIFRQRERVRFRKEKGWCNSSELFSFFSAYKSCKILANEYTKECLQKLSKPQFIAMVLGQRYETKATIESLRDEVKEINSNF